jgi:hypothetical protein
MNDEKRGGIITELRKALTSNNIDKEKVISWIVNCKFENNKTYSVIEE